MIPRHQRECYEGTLGVQLAHLAEAVKERGGYGVSGGPHRARMGVRGGGSAPRVKITPAMIRRIKARKGARYAESQSVLARDLALSTSMIKMVRTGGKGVCV